MTANDVEDADSTTRYAAIQEGTVIPSTFIGGGNGATSWTERLNHASKKLARPISTMVRRTTDFKSSNIIDNIDTKGIPVALHIGTEKNISNIILTLWINSTRYHTEERGLDTVFYVYANQTDTEKYLLTDWGSVVHTNIEA